MSPGKPPDVIELAAKSAGLDDALSRRGFLVFSACAVSSLAALGLCEAFAANPPLVVLDNATGMILADPSRCVGCQRCELACTEFNEGLAQPSLARIKITRSLNFGPAGPTGGSDMHGTWGDGLVVQGVCRQCPHPVPCATACPENAIVSDPRTGARVVDTERCVGCRLCQQACPWDMMSFNEERQKASKCFLCNGKPKCVEACPSGALRFAPWRDITGEAPPTAGPQAARPTAKAKARVGNHAPAAKNPTHR